MQVKISLQSLLNFKMNYEKEKTFVYSLIVISLIRLLAPANLSIINKQ